MTASVHAGVWDLTPADRLLVEAKRWGNLLRFAVMLLFFRACGRDNASRDTTRKFGPGLTTAASQIRVAPRTTA